MTEAGSRAAEGTALPPAGVWDVDLAHSNVEFVERHLFTNACDSPTSPAGSP